jgi:hypothetical protein
MERSSPTVSTVGIGHLRRRYSGFTITVSGEHGSKVPFSSRKRHLLPGYRGHINCETALESDLHGGCYNDANPHDVTSVKLLIAADAPKPKLDLVFSILQKEGWPREKVQVQSWDRYPQTAP